MKDRFGRTEQTPYIPTRAAPRSSFPSGALEPPVRCFPCADDRMIVVTSVGDAAGPLAQALEAAERFAEEQGYLDWLAEEDPAAEVPEPKHFDLRPRIEIPPGITADWRAVGPGVLIEIAVSGAVYQDGTAEPDCNIVLGWTTESGCPPSALEGRDVTLVLLPTVDAVITAPEPNCDPRTGPGYRPRVTLILPYPD